MSKHAAPAAEPGQPKPYSKYKPSGVEWLGEIPEHWAVKRLRQAAQLLDHKVEADEDAPLPYIGLENIEGRTGKILPVDSEVVPRGTANAFKSGNTLFAKLRPYLAKACNPDFDGLCSTELLVLKGKCIDRKALLFSLLSDGFIKLVDSSTYGSKMPRARWDFIGDCRIPVPPPAEQESIAEFLDLEIGKIDALVTKKQELIKRIKERRTALISRTVTRGLPVAAALDSGFDPNPKLNPSGQVWLGDIPAHWKAVQLRHAAFILDCKHRTVSFIDDGIPLASIREVHGYEVDLRGAKQTTLEEYLDLIEGDRRPREGDIIYSRNASVGDAALVTTNEKFCMGQDVCLIRSPKNYPKFLLYLFRSAPLIEQVESLMIGSTFRRINVGQIHGFWVTVPPLPEQVAIASYLDSVTTKLDAVSARLKEAIQRLLEYRTSLISAVVTGKIDVREANA